LLGRFDVLTAVTMKVAVFRDVAPCRLVSSCHSTVAYPGIFLGGGGFQQIQFEDRGQRERGSGGGSPLVRGSEGSCNLVQEISFHIVKFS